MAKAWKDVIASPQYQALAPEQKAQAQEQYFNEVVAPQAGENAEQAKQAFYSAYPRGLLEKGNIDIHNRPVVKNSDGSISTVRSMSTNIDGREVLIPTVSDDGRIMSDDEAIDNFMRTGKHLGMFDNPDDATAYAESLHNQQADEYLPRKNQATQQPVQQSTQAAPQQQKEEPSLMQQAGDWLTGGQSAGQIAEQAGRGLVNIPFDVLQGGASLINAISQGLGGPKVLDDVYRPVDRPTDPYAQAGESIGGYLVPGAGVAGNMVIGSLADAANQRGDFAENAAINAGLNIATHGLINGVTRGVRGASNIISGNKTSAQRATTAATETSPFSGDAAAATNPAVHAAEARVAQGVPMTPATRNPEEVVRTVAAQKRPNLASSLDELDINPQAEVLESAERLNVDSLLPSHFSGNEQYKAVEQAIKSRAGSALQVQENEAIRQLAQGAGEIIDRVSGAKDALGMSDKFIDTVNGRMSALMKRSDQL